MNTLSLDLVDTVSSFLKGKRLEKFLASVDTLNESIRLDGWVKRGRDKSGSGFYQGLVSKIVPGGPFSLEMCLQYGRACSDEFTDEQLEAVCPKVPIYVVRAWMALTTEVKDAKANLDLSRPLPKVTKVGLSPRVTKTLTECNLDLDLASIRLAEIKYELVPFLDEQGKRAIRKRYYVAWSEGIVHNQSRHIGSGCEACGKHIPSRRFVPIEAHCKRLDKTVSLWVGCDCASNIFGIKDIGLARQ